MKKISELFLRAEAWQQKHRKILVITFILGSAPMLGFRFFRRTPFFSETIETLYTLGLWVWFGAMLIWIFVFITPLFAAYARRTQAGENYEQAMMFGAKRPFTGSVFWDAVIFASVIILALFGIVAACIY